MWGNQILDQTLKIHKINAYSIAPEFDNFHKLEFDMSIFIYVYF